MGMWLKLATIFLMVSISSATEFVLGYLTGSQRRHNHSLYERPGLRISGALPLAVEDANTKILNGTGVLLKFVYAETYGEEQTSIFETANLWKTNISVYIGPQETCVHEGRFAAAINMPMISYFCGDHEVSDKRNFPTFARTIPPISKISKSVASLLNHFNWTQVTFLYLSSSEQKEVQKVASTILSVLSDSGVNVRMKRTWSTSWHYGYGDNPFYQIVQDTYVDTRIYLILGPYYEQHGLLLALDEMRLLDEGDYYVVGVDTDQYDQENPSKYLRPLLEDKEVIPPHLFRSYLAVVPTSHPSFVDFNSRINNRMQEVENKSEESFYAFNYTFYQKFGGLISMRAEAAYLYDAVQLYARAIVEIKEELENDTHENLSKVLRNGTYVFTHIQDKLYLSAMGYMVHIDANGDANGNYSLLHMQPLKEVDKKSRNISDLAFGLYPAGDFILASNSTALPELRLLSKDILVWIKDGPPLAEPPCGFRNEKCLAHRWEVVVGIIGIFGSVISIVLIAFYRNYKYEQELDSLLWKIDFKEIQINEQSSSTKTHRSTHPLIRTSQVSLSSNPDADFRFSNIYTTIGVYKDQVYAIKRIAKRSIDITRAMKKELKIMRDMRHDNLNAFIGASTEPPNICIISGYCTRGSLKDILENEDIKLKLDNMFIASLVRDIITYNAKCKRDQCSNSQLHQYISVNGFVAVISLKGMIFLHGSLLHYHGNLKAVNCLVDSRWVLKLTDFGLWEFKKGQENSPHHFLQHDESEETLNCKCEGLLYRAPELLSEPNLFYGGTQKGDAYSFAIILHEVLCKQGPFGIDAPGMNMHPSEILKQIVDSKSPTPFRPRLDLTEISSNYIHECLKECWVQNPELRPDFKVIRHKLRPVWKGMKSDIFDNMMCIMEKHAYNLESMVDERTAALQEEKKVTDALLYQILPRSVADQLKAGKKVEPENFSCVTLFFSDIAGFTAMSAKSTPLEVVDFLNDLYTLFDSIVRNYDVFKVETIGDAYMVVSGCPIRNGDRHADQIASMSLDLLGKVRHFVIRHQPSEELQLRIGIHSGSICAGVVGHTRPRYCLFGDTVNTASRMEATGEPLKIHCSTEFKQLLDHLGGYIVKERGIVHLKGKGSVKTYWLEGEDLQEKERRTKELAKNEARIHGLPRKLYENIHPSENGYPPRASGVLRSSLKRKNLCSMDTRTSLARCVSLESSKKLRFADNYKLPGLGLVRDSLEVIVNEKPSNTPSPVTEVDKDLVSRYSNSCPCIKKLALIRRGEGIINLRNSLMMSRDISLHSSNSVPLFYPLPPLLLHPSQIDHIPISRHLPNKKASSALSLLRTDSDTTMQ